MSSRPELPPVTPETLEGELLPFADDFGLPSLDHIGRTDLAAADVDDALAEDAAAPARAAVRCEQRTAPLAPSLLVPEPRLAPKATPESGEVGSRRKRRPTQDEANHRERTQVEVAAPQPIEEVAAAEDETEQAAATAEAAADTERVAEGTAQHASDPLDEQTPAEDFQPFAASCAVSASEARYAAVSALSLLGASRGKDDAKEDDGDDPRNSALAVAGGLRPGEEVFIRTSLELDGDASARHREQIAAMKRGETPRATGGGLSRGAGKAARLLGLASLRVLRAAFAAAAKSDHSKGTPVKHGEETVVLSKEQKAALDNAHDKLGGERETQRIYRVRHSVAVVGGVEDGARLAEHRQRIESKLAALGNAHQQLLFQPCDGYDAVTGSWAPSGVSLRERREGHDLLMSPREIALLAAPHGDATNPRGVNVVRSIKSFEPTQRIVVADPLATGEAVPVGVVLPDSDDEFVQGVPVEALTRHVAGFGKSGSGKSVWTEWLTYGLAKREQPVMVLDPHGALADNLLLMLAAHAKERLDDVVVLDFSSKPTLLDGNPFADDLRPHAIGFNPLDVETEDDIDSRKTYIAELLDTHFKLSSSGTPRARNYVEQLLTALMHANLALREQSKSLLTLLSVVPFLTDDTFRALVVECCPVAEVHTLYGPEGTFTKLAERTQLEYIGPILRAFMPLAGRQAFANVFSASDNQLDFAKLVKPGCIIIVKLSRFADEKELGQFVGQLIIPSLLGSMHKWGRDTNPYSDKSRDGGLTLVVDEAHTLVRSADSGVTTVLAEARKYGFGVVLMTQFPDQYEPEVRKAVMANTDSRLTFALDPTTVRGAAEGLSSSKVKLTDNDMLALADHRFHGYAKFSDSGTFTFRGLPPIFDAVNPGNTYTARRGVPTPPQQQLQERVAAMYRQSHQLAYTPVEQLRARREAVNGKAHPTPDGELSQPVKRTRMVEEAIEALTRAWQQRVAHATGAPVPTEVVREQSGPSATRPNAPADTGQPRDEEQAAVFDPRNPAYGNAPAFEDPATTDIFGEAT